MFADWASGRLEEDPNSDRKIILSSKAPFWMNSDVNKYNYHIWDEDNPHKVHPVVVYSQKVTLWYGGVIGPYFLKTTLVSLVQSTVSIIELDESISFGRVG